MKPFEPELHIWNDTKKKIGSWEELMELTYSLRNHPLIADFEKECYEDSKEDKRISTLLSEVGVKKQALEEELKQIFSLAKTLTKKAMKGIENFQTSFKKLERFQKQLFSMKEFLLEDCSDPEEFSKTLAKLFKESASKQLEEKKEKKKEIIDCSLFHKWMSENGLLLTSNVMLCKICATKPVSITFSSCGHVVCKDCNLRLTSLCPFCRKTILGRHEIFF